MQRPALDRPPMLLPIFQDAAERRAFCSTLATRALGRRIVVLEETTSTSDVARDTDLAHGTCVNMRSETLHPSKTETSELPCRAVIVIAALSMAVKVAVRKSPLLIGRCCVVILK